MAVQLLADIVAVMKDGKVDAMHSEDVAAALVELEGRPWAEWGYKSPRPITKNQVAAHLKPFSISPKQTFLNGRNRNGYRLHHRFNERQRMVEVAHQRRAGLAAGHVPRRAAHIDIDDVGASVGGDRGAFRHPARLAAGDLHHVQSAAVILDAPPRDTLLRGAPAAGKRRTCGHFRDHKAGAKPRREPPERRIGDARHRRQKHRIGQRDRADSEAFHGRPDSRNRGRRIVNCRMG